MDFRKCLGVFLLIMLGASRLHAYDEPNVNLGLTSFLDGGLPAGPGVYFEEYLFHYSGNFKDNKGKSLPLPKAHIDATINLFQLAYISDQKIFGANWGVELLLPWALRNQVSDGLDNTVLQGRDGLGDLIAGFILQFDPIQTCDGQPLFVHRFEFVVFCPTGRYHREVAVNPGSNFWSITPYWAATAWWTPKLSSSLRLHYLWNSKNTDPVISFGPTVRSIQAGQAVYANFTLDYAILEKFIVGLNGYCFDQFTDTKVDGQRVSGRRESVWAIGPGALYMHSPDHNVFFNAFFEQDAKNRPEGQKYVLRYAFHF